MERLTKVEEEVMQHIWSFEKCTVADILGKYGKDKPPHSTISSVVRILEKKGFVDHKAYGRTYEYFIKIPKEDYTKRSLSTLVADYFQGSPKDLVSFLVSQKSIDPQELKQVLNEIKKS